MAKVACLLLLASAARAQTRPTDSLRVVPLAAVQVRPPQVFTLRPPGESKGLFSNFMALEMTPTRQVAVWHPAPDAGRRYLVRAVRVQLGSRLPENPGQVVQARRRFAEGYLALRLAGATAAGVPADTNLLAAPLLLTPAVSARSQRGWVSFDVAAQQVQMPPAGVFVVAEGFANPGERFVRSRQLLHPADGRHPPEDYVHKPGEKLTEIFLYEEVQAAGSAATRLVLRSNYPALAQLRVAAPADNHSWLHGYQPGRPHGWFKLAVHYALLRQSSPALKLTDYNYDLELEIEEL